MSPRQRSKSKRGWPANLYERNGYFSWRSPVDGVEHGLGRDRAAAFAQAVEANVHCAGLSGKPRLIDRLTGAADRSVAKWNEKYQALLAKTDLAKATLRNYRSLGNRMVVMLKPETHLTSVTSLVISDGLSAIAEDEGKARLAQALRNYMRDSFREARVQGWYTDDNPVMDTKLSVSVTVKRSRLSLEVFQQVYRTTDVEWLKNAMALALVSAQRLDDVSSAQFKAFHDGGWWCVQSSLKGSRRHRLVIPLTLRLDCFGMSLAEVVAQCRRTDIASKYLVHQTISGGGSPLGRNIWRETISRRFSDALSALGIDWGDKSPPTFHEIRSLAERLYAAQGDVNTQELLGHNDAATTAMYHDDRGLDWVRIKVTV